MKKLKWKMNIQALIYIDGPSDDDLKRIEDEYGDYLN